MTSVVLIHHPQNERVKLYVKASKGAEDFRIHWAHLDKKNDFGKWQREWIDLNKHPLFGYSYGQSFWDELRRRGFEEEEVRMQIAEWIERDTGGIL